MTSNIPFTTSKARSSLSAGPGIGYDSTTGTISLTAMNRFIPYVDFALVNNATLKDWDQVNIATGSTLPGLRLDQTSILPVAAETVRVKVPLFISYNPTAADYPTRAIIVDFPYRVNQSPLTAAPTVAVFQENYGTLGPGPTALTINAITSTIVGNVATQTAANQYQFMRISFTAPLQPTLTTHRYVMEVTFNDAASPTSQPSIYGAFIRLS